MRPFAGLFLLLLLLLPVYSITQQWFVIPAVLLINLPWLPYAFIATGLILCVIFYNSREFCLLLVTGSIFWLLQNYVWSKGLPGITKEQLFDLLSIFLPANLMALYFLRERGLLNQHGIKRLVFILIEITVLIWLIHANKLGFSSWLARDFFNLEITRQTVLKQTVIIFWLITITSLMINWLFKGGFMNAIWLLALISLLISMHLVQNVLISTIYIIITSLILIAGIVIHAYNLAYRDELTLLPSRRALKQQLLALGKNYSIAMVDVDHFKKLNDTYGHDVGDDVLKLLASHLLSVEGGGKAFRYGGEEFTVVFPGKDAEYAAEYLDKLRQQIAISPFIIRHKKRPRKKPEKRKSSANTKQINITVSIGVSEKQEKHDNPQEVIKSADNALYNAKENGRNQVVVE